MDNKMKAFMNEMAEVFEKHNITMMEVVRSAGCNGVEVEGIEFTMADDDGNMDFAQIDGIWIEADDFRDATKS